MTNWRGSLLICAAAIAGFEPSPASAGMRTIELSAANVEVRTFQSGREGDYYIVSFDLPEDLGQVRFAWLELRVDVVADTVEGFIDPAPMLEAHLVSAPLIGDPTGDDFIELQRPMSRPVAVGAQRNLKIDVTHAVRVMNSNATGSFQFVLGALTGERRGTYVVDRGGNGLPRVGRVTITDFP